MGRQSHSHIPQVRMSFKPGHQAVHDACVVAGPLLDIIKQSNQLLKERGFSEQSPAEIVRALNSMRLLNLVAETDNGTWFAPVTPHEQELVQELNEKRKAPTEHAAG